MSPTGGPALLDAAARRSRRVLALAVCALGFSAFLTQLTLMRELLSVFAGNELVLGLVLGSWLLLSGCGTHGGRVAARCCRPAAVLAAAQTALAVLPIVLVCLLRGLRYVVFHRGAAVGVTETLAACLVVLLPFCVLAGCLLTLASTLLATRPDASSIGWVYGLDTVGGIAGGVLFTWVFVERLDHFQILLVAAAVNLLAAAAVAVQLREAGENGDGLHNRSYLSASQTTIGCGACPRFQQPPRRWGLLAAAVAIAAALGGGAAVGDLNRRSAQALFPGQELVALGHSPYGSVAVTRSSGQLNFYENGVPLFSTGNVEKIEETVHFALAQRPAARRVLLVSGGLTGTAQEILRYPAAEVDYVELDPLLLRLAEQHLPGRLADPRIHVINTDGRWWVRRTQQRYDVVIVDVPDPSNSQLNRFYTREFFREVAGCLTPNGVLSLGLGHYENYLSPELARLLAVAHQTLAQEFDQILLLPAGRVFFLASAGPLTADVVPRWEQHGLRHQWLTRENVADLFRGERLAAVGRAVTPEAAVNTDWNPVLYYHDLLYWMSQFPVRCGVLAGGLGLLLLWCLPRARPVSFTVFTLGLTASALEVVLLLAHQVLYGSVYHEVAWIVTMFMVGLGSGTLAMNRRPAGRARRDLLWLQLAMVVYAASLPAVLVALGRAGPGTLETFAGRAAVPLLTAVLGLLVGAAIPLAGKADFRTVADTAARVYTADYLGAAVGALVVSAWLIPVAGVPTACLVCAALNLAGGAVLGFKSGAAAR